ncbi:MULTISPECIES: BatD family protein [Apibacter]|uniref:BatD family protein n=1 Tax=Apibacter TaxID=1778601 RepID=UPI001C6A62B3|nr:MULTISPECIES: BatD family protein [Apibacter]QYN51574.1 protein BatD [Apibacter sp. ESL0404]
MKFKIFIVYFFIAAILIHAQIPVSKISTDYIKFGEPIVLKITVKTGQKDTIIFPTITDTLSEKFEVLRQKKDTLSKNNSIFINDSIIFSAYEEGTFSVPPQRILVNSKEYFTPSYKVTVAPVVTDSVKTPLFDIKSIVQIPKNVWDYIQPYLGYVLILLVILVCVIIYFIRRKKKKSETYKSEPDVLAIKRLKKLKKSNYIAKDLYKKYYSELTSIIKEYMEARWNFPATKLLSDDLLEYLKKEKWIDENEIENLSGIFKTSDLAKFAKYKPTPEEAKLHMEKAIKFINLTKTDSPKIKLQDES